MCILPKIKHFWNSSLFAVCCFLTLSNHSIDLFNLLPLCFSCPALGLSLLLSSFHQSHYLIPLCLSRPLISVCQPHPQLAINMIFFVLQDGLKIQTFLQAYTCFFGSFQYSSPWFHLCFGGLIIGTFDAPFSYLFVLLSFISPN